VTLLGAFRLTAAGRELRLPAGAQRLVALIAVRGRIGRSRLAGTLWPDVPEPRALASLRTAIWRVNREVSDLVECAGGQVALAAAVEVDVRTLVAQSIELLQKGPLGDLRFATDLPDHDMLPDWDDPWLTEERERLRQLRLHVLEAIADHFADGGYYGLAVDIALCTLRADALRESAHRTLVRAHLAEGNINEARRAYLACERILRRELGIEPSAAMRGLLHQYPCLCCTASQG
jgi:DNA-binding SARP family transcriptional activator